MKLLHLFESRDDLLKWLHDRVHLHHSAIVKRSCDEIHFMDGTVFYLRVANVTLLPRTLGMRFDAVVGLHLLQSEMRSQIMSRIR